MAAITRSLSSTKKQRIEKNEDEVTTTNDQNSESGNVKDYPVFWSLTAETEWGPDSSKRKYTLRYVKGDICCSSPWNDTDPWPKINIPFKNEEDEVEDAEEDERQGDEGEGNEATMLCSVIGSVCDEKGELVGLLLSNEDDDGHIEFCYPEDYENFVDFNDLCEQLCTEICPEMADVFDDGSGISREPIPVPPSVFSQTFSWFGN